MSVPNRRDFVKNVVLTAPLAGLATGAGLDAAQGENANRSDVARLLAEVVRARHGRTLDEGRLKNIQSKIAGGLSSGRVLQQLNLVNSDEPDMVFFAEEP